MDSNKVIDSNIKYPGVSDRVKAAVVDSVIIVIFLFIASYLLSYFDTVFDYVRILTFSFIFIFYDPLFTSFFGGTFGHMAMGIRVKRRTNPEKNIILPLAIIRFIAKYTLGIISLFTVGSNSKNLAIHDLIGGSIVLFKNSDPL